VAGVWVASEILSTQPPSHGYTIPMMLTWTRSSLSPQAIYKRFDIDRSGTICSNELPGAFEAAGGAGREVAGGRWQGWLRCPHFAGLALRAGPGRGLGCVAPTPKGLNVLRLPPERASLQHDHPALLRREREHGFRQLHQLLGQAGCHVP
jgi:hypothetical protein